jgi:hypothetical protein
VATFSRTKKKLYGVGGIVLVGGTGPNNSHADNEEDSIETKIRSPSNIEPVCFGAETTEFYENLLAWHNAKAFINLTSTDINAALAAVELKIPYLGIVFTDYHKDFFLAEMVRRVFACFQNENSSLFEPDLVALLEKKAAPKPKPGKPHKGGAEPKAKGKPKPGKSQKGGADPKAKGKPKPGKPGKKMTKAQMLKALKALDGGEDDPEGDEDDEDEEEEESVADSEGGE